MLFRGPMGGGAASGKIGAMIASHCAQGQYLKSRVKSTNPRSELQHVPRNALARLAAFWTEQLTAPQQAAWATYAANVTWLNRLGDTVHLSGQMEFIRSNAPRLQADVLYGDPFDFPLLGIVADAPTIFDRGDPGPTPTINMVPGNDYLTMVYDNTADWVTSDTSNAMLVYVAIPKNSSVSFFRRRTRLAGIVHASDATGAFNFLNQWLPAIAYRQKWTAWWTIARADGRLTRAVPVAPFDTGPPPPPPWTDPITYPDGNLWGNDSWTNPGISGHSPQVNSDTIRIIPPNTVDANVTDSKIPSDWTDNWYFQVDVMIESGAGATTFGMDFFLGGTDGGLSPMPIDLGFSWNGVDPDDDVLSFITAAFIPSGTIVATDIAFTAGNWHTLRWSMLAGSFTIAIDGVTVTTGSATIGSGTANLIMITSAGSTSTKPIRTRNYECGVLV